MLIKMRSKKITNFIVDQEEFIGGENVMRFPPFSDSGQRASFLFIPDFHYS